MIMAERRREKEKDVTTDISMYLKGFGLSDSGFISLEEYFQRFLEAL